MAQWLVTGANRGIGLELCRALSARGDDVIAVCRSTSDELDALGCVVIEGIDVAQSEAGAISSRRLPTTSSSMCSSTTRASCFATRSTISTTPGSSSKSTLSGHSASPTLCCRGCVKARRSGSSRAGQGRSAIVRREGPTGIACRRPRSTWVRPTLRIELAPRGIHVVALHPGFIRTDMTSGAGNEDPREAAVGLIARLDELDASRSGRFFHAHGDEIPW